MKKIKKSIYLIAFLFIFAIQAPANSEAGELAKLSITKGDLTLLDEGKVAIEFISLEPSANGSRLGLRIKNLSPTRMTRASLFVAFNLNTEITMARTGYKISTVHDGRIITETFEPYCWTSVFIEVANLRTDEVKFLSLSLSLKR